MDCCHPHLLDWKLRSPSLFEVDVAWRESSFVLSLLALLPFTPFNPSFRMSMSVPLFTSSLTSSQVEQILNDIRSSDYIKEISSGETSPQESGLWNLVLPFQSSTTNSSHPKDDFQPFISETKSLDESKWYRNCLVVADERTLDKDDGSLVVIQLDSKGEKKDSLRVARGSILEIVSTLFKPRLRIVCLY